MIVLMRKLKQGKGIEKKSHRKLLFYIWQTGKTSMRLSMSRNLKEVKELSIHIQEGKTFQVEKW